MTPFNEPTTVMPQKKGGRAPSVQQRFDLAIIGAGSGGMAAARAARADGLSVALFENRHMGGACVNVDCVPKKLLVHGSRFADALQEAGHFGWTVRIPTFDWQGLRDTVDQEVRRLSGHHRRRLEDLGAVIVAGRASLAAPGLVETDSGTRVAARSIIIATGARSRVPRLDGMEHAILSDDLFHLTRLPRRMAVIGSGYIAVEFASLLARFGVAVTIFERGPRILKAFDADVVHALTQSTRDRGIALETGAGVAAIAADGTGKAVTLEDGRAVHGFGEVLVAAGREPNTHNLGLDTVGVRLTEHGSIAVDDEGRTSVLGVFAVGDMAATMMLTPRGSARCPPRHR